MDNEPDRVSEDDSTLEFSIEVSESSSSAESLEFDSIAGNDSKSNNQDENCEINQNELTEHSGDYENYEQEASNEPIEENRPDESKSNNDEQNDSETAAHFNENEQTEPGLQEADQIRNDDSGLKGDKTNLEEDELEKTDLQIEPQGLKQEHQHSDEIKHDKPGLSEPLVQSKDVNRLVFEARTKTDVEEPGILIQQPDISADADNELKNEIEENDLPTQQHERRPLDEKYHGSEGKPDLTDAQLVDNKSDETIVGLIEQDNYEMPDVVVQDSIIDLFERKQAEPRDDDLGQNITDEQQLERQQQLIEEQLIELVDQTEEDLGTGEQQCEPSNALDQSQNELDLTINERDQLERASQEELKEDLETEIDQAYKIEEPEATCASSKSEGPETLVIHKLNGDQLIDETLEDELNTRLIQPQEPSKLGIPTTIKQSDTNSQSHQAAEATPTQLGSPDIQINGRVETENEFCDGSNDLELLQKLTLTKDGLETIDSHDDEDNGYSDCKTPTPDGNLLLDTNCLGYIKDRISGSQESSSCESDQETIDLEAESDNEPAFEPRVVSPKRGVAPVGEYDFADELGRGKFGTVFKVRNKLSGLELAAKMISIRRQEDLKDVEREVAIMIQLQHPRLLQLYDAFLDFQSSDLANGFKQICIITELILGGELFERIVDDDFDLTEKKAAIFMRQICEGVDYMHSMGFVHLDMKPENILCVSKTSNRIKLIDFGLARKIEPGQPLRVMFGTPDFAAPEVLNYDVVSYATDMWSVGVICYVLLSGLSPFMGDSDVETMANVQRATYDFDSDAFDPITELAKDFIGKLLIKDPKLRLKPRECLEHPWLERGGRMLEVAIKSRRESIISIMSSKSDSYDISNTIGPSGICSLTSLNKRNLKKYVIRRKWHKTVNAIMALRRMGASLKQKLIGANQT